VLGDDGPLKVTDFKCWTWVVRFGWMRWSDSTKCTVLQMARHL